LPVNWDFLFTLQAQADLISPVKRRHSSMLHDQTVAKDGFIAVIDRSAELHGRFQLFAIGQLDI